LVFVVENIWGLLGIMIIYYGFFVLVCWTSY